MERLLGGRDHGERRSLGRGDGPCQGLVVREVLMGVGKVDLWRDLRGGEKTLED
jgi:hypothetical protein